MQTAFGAFTAVATFLMVQPRDAMKRKLTCCAGRTHAAPQQDTETVFRVQSSANTASATATHIFPSFSPRKSLKPIYTQSKSQVARGKLHGFWTWMKDPTGFDDLTDKLKARRKAAKVGRARAVQSALMGKAIFMPPHHSGQHTTWQQQSNALFKVTCAIMAKQPYSTCMCNCHQGHSPDGLVGVGVICLTWHPVCRRRQPSDRCITSKLFC